MVTSSKVLDVLLTYFGGFKSKHPKRYSVVLGDAQIHRTPRVEADWGVAGALTCTLGHRFLYLRTQIACYMIPVTGGRKHSR